MNQTQVPLTSVRLTPAEIKAEIDRRRYNKREQYFPETGPLRRELYPTHMEFFKATGRFRETGFMAANRVGKSESLAYAADVFARGDYPPWWEGKRFNRPVNILIGGETGKLVRDSIQMKLMGPPGSIGTGMIPKDAIIDYRPKHGIPDAIDTVRIKHSSGRESLIQFQSYDQGREAFQATERDVIIEDEEPPLAIHTESLIRTMTTGGIVMMGFTPLKGISDTVLSMQEKERNGQATIVSCTWDQVPHLTEKDKAELLAALPPHQRDARSKGIPQLGAGAVFPILETDIICDPVKIPPHWFQGYGLDVGWNFTGCMWGAYDQDNDIVYLTGEYKRSQAEPSVHGAAIKARGEWIPGVIDPASRGRQQADGKQLLQLYQDQGLQLSIANNAVEAGVHHMYERMTTGRLKVFKTCTEWLSEFRLYRREEDGKIVKQNDHLMDASRYLCMTKMWTQGYYADKSEALFAPKGKHEINYDPLSRGHIAQDHGGVYNPFGKR
jgi:phage terminase large subunit-like protein